MRGTAKTCLAPLLVLTFACGGGPSTTTAESDLALGNDADSQVALPDSADAIAPDRVPGVEESAAPDVPEAEPDVSVENPDTAAKPDAEAEAPDAGDEGAEAEYDAEAEVEPADPSDDGPDGESEDHQEYPDGSIDPVSQDEGQETDDECVAVPFVPLCGYMVKNTLPWLEGPPPFSPDDPSLVALIAAVQGRGYCTGVDLSTLDPETQAVMRVGVEMVDDQYCGFRLIELLKCTNRYEARTLRVSCPGVEEFSTPFDFLYLIPRLSPMELAPPAARTTIEKELDCAQPRTPDEPTPCCMPFNLDECDSMYEELLSP